MDWMVRLSALSARVDRVLQSEERQRVAILKKEEWSTGVQSYLEKLQSEGMELFRTDRLVLAREWFPKTQIPSSWVRSERSFLRSFEAFDRSLFPYVYMGFGEKGNCLLFMTEALVLKANLVTVERRVRNMQHRVEKLHNVHEEVELDVDDPYLIPDFLTTPCTVDVFLLERHLISGIVHVTHGDNCYDDLQISGPRVVLEFSRYEGHILVDCFVLTYCFDAISADEVASYEREDRVRDEGGA
jgi:hypothetical protein